MAQYSAYMTLESASTELGAVVFSLPELRAE